MYFLFFSFLFSGAIEACCCKSHIFEVGFSLFISMLFFLILYPRDFSFVGESGLPGRVVRAIFSERRNIHGCLSYLHFIALGRIFRGPGAEKSDHDARAFALTSTASSRKCAQFQLLQIGSIQSVLRRENERVEKQARQRPSSRSCQHCALYVARFRGSLDLATFLCKASIPRAW